MASPARVFPRRLGQLAAQTRLATTCSARLPTTSFWICRQSVFRAKATTAGRKAFSSSSVSSANASSANVDAETGQVDHADDASHVGAGLYLPLDTFARRHIGPDDKDMAKMLKELSPPVESLDAFVEQVIPRDILSAPTMEITKSRHAFTESTLFKGLAHFEKKITIKQSFIGTGYYDTLTPAVIQRNVLENPAWYTSYTPYQPEISQGRLESLLNFQTMVCDLTGLPFSNASLLDEGTAAAEAMTLSMNALSSSRAKRAGKTFVVSDKLHPQTIQVVRGRADGFGINIKTLDVMSTDASTEIKSLGEDLIGVMVQYPDTYGGVDDFRDLAALVHKQGSLLSCATDLLALTILKPPGEWGADIAFGSAQRLGVPMGYGGPHAAFFAVTEKYKRKIPGRLVGLSKDRLGGKAYRLALQTREQHIRREKATSNVCTSQALLANMGALYAVYHGPEGLKAIAKHIVRGARIVQSGLESLGFKTSRSGEPVLFDTVVVDLEPSTASQEQVIRQASSHNMDFRRIGTTKVGISIDETTNAGSLAAILATFRLATESSSVSGGQNRGVSAADVALFDKMCRMHPEDLNMPEAFRRTSSYLTHPVFNTHHSETELLRYIHHLQSKDLSLVHSMIPLGSCTMKLNGTAEMALITRPKFSKLHPYAPDGAAFGFQSLLRWFMRQLASITGMDKVSLQPNSGAQGEFAGLRTIREYLKAHGKGEKKRDICLIPVSAHGTNPASAAMAGMRVVPLKCDTKTGNLDIADLESKCQQYQDELGAIMITYPSTFGVFEPEVKKACALVHEYGGQVYMDGANMNAQIGLCSPGDIGADVCHLNLHKTFCIPHGGGGPGVGPICVKEHLGSYLPGNPNPSADGETKPHPVSSSQFGSASINLISWAYNSLMGEEGLRQATKVTLLNANYLLSRLKKHYSILYTNQHDRCAHEFILDVRPFSKTAGVEAIDIAKRLQDYGFHAPTMSWPVANTLMIEPTESESLEELDRFVDALLSIREEIREVEEGKQPRAGNVLKMAPHPMRDIVDGDGQGKWVRSYSRDKAAYPLPWLREKKFWPSVGRVDDTYGDLNLFCTCPPVEDTTGDN